MLYIGLIQEFEKLTDEEKGTHHLAMRYFDAVGYSYGRFQAQAKKVREAMIDG